MPIWGCRMMTNKMTNNAILEEGLIMGAEFFFGVEVFLNGLMAWGDVFTGGTRVCPDL